MLYRQYYLSPIGRLSLVASEESLYGIWLEGQNHFQSGVNEAELVDASNPVLKKTKHWLEAYFKGDNPSPDILPLADRGTDFQQKVWSVLGRYLMDGPLAMDRLASKSPANPLRL